MIRRGKFRRCTECGGPAYIGHVSGCSLDPRNLNYEFYIRNLAQPSNPPPPPSESDQLPEPPTIRVADIRSISMVIGDSCRVESEVKEDGFRTLTITRDDGAIAVLKGVMQFDWVLPPDFGEQVASR